MNNWVHTEDRLPEEHRTVLIMKHYQCAGFVEYAVAYLNDGECIPDPDLIDSSGDLTINVTPDYWMPLPEPPEEQSK